MKNVHSVAQEFGAPEPKVASQHPQGRSLSHECLTKRMSKATKPINPRPNTPIVKKLLLRFSLVNKSGRPLMVRNKIKRINTAKIIPKI